MATCDYNCAELPDHARVSCQDYETGGIDAFAVVECDQASITDWTDAAEWNTAIAAGEVKVIKGIRGQVPESEAREITNPVGGSSDNFTVNYNRTFTWVDNNVSGGNNSFYNELNRRRTFLVYHLAESDTIRVLEEVPADFQVREMVPESTGELTGYMGTAKWTYFDMPAIYAAPTGIFTD